MTDKPSPTDDLARQMIAAAGDVDDPQPWLALGTRENVRRLAEAVLSVHECDCGSLAWPCVSCLRTERDQLRTRIAELEAEVERLRGEPCYGHKRKVEKLEARIDRALGLIHDCDCALFESECSYCAIRAALTGEGES